MRHRSLVAVLTVAGALAFALDASLSSAAAASGLTQISGSASARLAPDSSRP